MLSRDKVYIFDISGFIHRSFHAYNDLTTSYGFPVGAVYGTLSMMLHFIDKHKPDSILICYDAQTAASVRKEIYPAYKANRVQVETVSQEERIIRQLFKLLNFPSVELEGYEADDLIATAVSCLKTHMDCVVVSSDKDMLQLVQPNVVVFEPMRGGQFYDEEQALKKFGVKANQIAEYLALAGDKADNIPGAAGIGPKAAQDLLGTYATVEEILLNLDDVSPKYRDKLIKSRDNIIISRKLTGLFDTLDAGITPEFVKFKPVENTEIFALLEKLEFKNMKVDIELMWQAYS